MPLPLTPTVIQALQADFARGAWSPLTLQWLNELIVLVNTQTTRLAALEASLLARDVPPREETP